LLLIFYHVVISFQPWGNLFAFPQNGESLEALWILMSLINVWRIPIVFMISGMGIRFAMKHRKWKALLKDRTVRILVPYVFGFSVVSPLNLYFASLFYQKPGTDLKQLRSMNKNSEFKGQTPDYPTVKFSPA